MSRNYLAVSCKREIGGEGKGDLEWRREHQRVKPTLLLVLRREKGCGLPGTVRHEATEKALALFLPSQMALLYLISAKLCEQQLLVPKHTFF